MKDRKARLGAAVLLLLTLSGNSTADTLEDYQALLSQSPLPYHLEAEGFEKASCLRVA